MTEPHFRGGLPSPMSGNGRLDLSLPSMPDLDLLQYLRSLGIEDSPFNQQARPVNPIRPRPTLAALRAQGGGVGLPQSLPTPMAPGSQLNLAPPPMPELPDMTGPGPAPMPVGPSPQSPFGQGLSTEALMGGPPPAQMVTDASMGGYRPPYFGNTINQNDEMARAIGPPQPPAPVAPQRARSPQEPPGPPPQAMPLLPPREELAGPVAEPPMVNHAAAASMMGAFPPAGQGVNPAARAAMLQIFPPESPFGAERPVEDYFSDASLQSRLQDAQRHARGQALLGFGAGMLGGQDLSSGFSAGAANIAAPMARLQQQREELPLQYAKERYDIESDRELRGYRRSADERAEAEAGRAAERFPYEKGSLEHQQKIQQREAGQIDSGLLDRMDALRETALQNSNNKDYQEIEYWKERIQRERRMEPHEINALKARISEMESQAGVNRANRAAIESGERYGDSAVGPKGLMTEGAAFNNMQEEYKAYENSEDYDPNFTPEQHKARLLRRMLWKVGQLDSATLDRMDPDLASAVAIQRAAQSGSLNDILSDPEIGPEIRANRTLMELINLLTMAPPPVSQ